MIDGIGGAFLFSNDTKRLAAWYRDCLGIAFQGEDAECSSVYASFEYRDLANPEIKRTIAWAIMPTDQDIKDKQIPILTSKFCLRCQSVHDRVNVDSCSIKMRKVSALRVKHKREIGSGKQDSIEAFTLDELVR